MVNWCKLVVWGLVVWIPIGSPKMKGIVTYGHPEKFPNHQFTNSWLGGETSNILYFHPYLGKIFTHFDVRIFFRWVGGFNHRCHLIFRKLPNKKSATKSDQLGGGNSIYSLFSLRYLGKSSNLANIFPMGWNHQLAKVLEATRGWKKQRWDVGGGEASRWASPQTVFSTFQGWPIKSIGEITIGKIGKAAFGAPRCMYTYTFDIQ